MQRRGPARLRCCNGAAGWVEGGSMAGPQGLPLPQPAGPAAAAAQQHRCPWGCCCCPRAGCSPDERPPRSGRAQPGPWRCFGTPSGAAGFSQVHEPFWSNLTAKALQSCSPLRCPKSCSPFAPHAEAPPGTQFGRFASCSPGTRMPAGAAAQRPQGTPWCFALAAKNGPDCEAFSKAIYSTFLLPQISR